MDEHDTFPQRVWQIVASIPEGCVTTYGEVARLAGSARGASGRRRAKEATRRKHVTVAPGRQSPWRHFTGPDLQRQRQALLSEGVQVSGAGQIDMQKYRWEY